MEAYNNKSEISKKLINEINRIDNQIKSITQSLIDAQAVSIRSALSSNNNWYVNLQKKWFGGVIQHSLSWHRDELIFLYKERSKLQKELDKLNGKLWTKRITRWALILLLLIVSLFIFWIILMGFITAIYLLPIWGSILLAYILLKGRSIQRF